MQAPVIVFTYKRPVHTQKVLDALSICVDIEKTDVYIFSDGAKENANEKDLELITQTRKVISDFEATQSAKVIHVDFATQNKGLAASVRGGVDKVLAHYQSIIVLEDDIVPARGFLRYMNDALEKYQDKKQVWGISAYAYPMKGVQRLSTNTFFLPVNSSWGWAMWKDRWQNINFDIADVWNTFQDRKIMKADYDFGAYYYYDILENQKHGKIDSWAVMLNSSMYLSDGFFLFPKYGLAQNIGFDTSGTHCSEEDLFFSTSETTDFLEVDDIPITINSEGRFLVEKSLKKHFSPSISQRIINKLNPKSPYFIANKFKS